MRIVLVSSQHHPAQGGIGAYVAEFVDVACEAGWTVQLITRPGPLLPQGCKPLLVTTADAQPQFSKHVVALRQIERIRPYRYGLWSLAVARRLLDLDELPDVVEFVDC